MSPVNHYGLYQGWTERERGRERDREGERERKREGQRDREGVSELVL